MQKKLFIFFFIFFIFSTLADAEIGPYCDNKINQTVLKDIDNLKIKNMEFENQEFENVKIA